MYNKKILNQTIKREQLKGYGFRSIAWNFAHEYGKNMNNLHNESKTQVQIFYQTPRHLVLK